MVTGMVGGAERALAALASRPDLSGANHTIALFTNNPRVRALFVDAGLTVRDRGPVDESPVGYLRRTYGSSDARWLARVVRDEGASCINAHTFATHLLAAKVGQMCNVPVIRSEADVMHYANPTCALYRRWALRHTTKIIANSQYVARFISEFEPGVAARIGVIYKGVDLSAYQPATAPIGPFTFAVAARLVPWKRVHLAIEALSRIPVARLNVLGDGSELPRLEALVRTHSLESRVIFHGYQPDPRPIIANSHAMVSCAPDENLSRALVEAAAMQRPAVAFPVGGLQEIVRDGSTGWITKDCTVDSLATSMATAAADHARAAAFGANARAWVTEIFAIERMAREYGRVYQEMVGMRSPKKHLDANLHVDASA
jgi:glycosyltransferase involved in cell wall biosynthesis